jgi:menaquinone-9 beta-reductase
MESKTYDCIIMGGGIAGLSLAICLAKAQANVLLLEKEDYPFHKVCGEYISNESKPFLECLGIRFESQQVVDIKQLLISSPSGYQLALSVGVEIKTNTKVTDVVFKESFFEIRSAHGVYFSKTAVGAYGKHIGIGIKLGRVKAKQNKGNLYVAVKYHIRTNFDTSQVEIHNFSGGYCGMSAVEDGKINMSYICKASQLKAQGSIEALEKNVMSKNPFLKKYLQEAQFVFEKPVTISNLRFEIKTPVVNHVLMIGDAAGNIAPLSGNGMSMGLRSAKLSAAGILQYLAQTISIQELENTYTEDYQKLFSKRIKTAGFINSLFGKKIITDASICILKLFPSLLNSMSKNIHGETF